MAPTVLRAHSMIPSLLSAKVPSKSKRIAFFINYLQYFIVYIAGGSHNLHPIFSAFLKPHLASCLPDNQGSCSIIIGIKAHFVVGGTSSGSHITQRAGCGANTSCVSEDRVELHHSFHILSHKMVTPMGRNQKGKGPGVIILFYGVDRLISKESPAVSNCPKERLLSGN